MVLDYQTIKLYDKPLFTWVTIQTPMKGSVPIPPEACFAYMLSGDGQTLVSDGQEEITARSGQVILSLCGRSVGQMLARTDRGVMNSLVVHFYKDILRKIYEDSKPPCWKELKKPVVKAYVQLAASELIDAYIAGLIPLFKNRSAVTEEILILKLKEIILLLMQTNNSEKVSNIMSRLFSERTFSFKEVIEAHIYDPITLDQLRILTNLSLSSFKRRFRKIYNSTPLSYMRDRRLERVSELLLVSDEPIQEIGYQCGFSSPEHLSHSFKKKYGISPKEYRNNHG